MPESEWGPDGVSTVHVFQSVLTLSDYMQFACSFYCNQEREEKFRQMSEETNGNVLWWAIIQTSILLSVGIWQMKNLKDFLIEKKLV